MDRSAARSAKRFGWGCEGTTRLCAGSFWPGDWRKICASVSTRVVPVDQMLVSIAPVADNAEAFTAVASNPAVNSLRISRSRSIPAGRWKWTARKRSVCLTTVAATNPTSAMKTWMGSPALVATARSLSAIMAAPESEMSLMRPVRQGSTRGENRNRLIKFEPLFAPTDRRL